MANNSTWKRSTVQQLQDQHVLYVEDGNHGEYRPLAHEFGMTGTHFIRAADMQDGRVNFESAQCISDSALARIRKGVGRDGDVLLSHKGTVGKVAWIPAGSPAFVCSPQTTFWRVLDETNLDQRYVFYFLQSRHFREQLDSRKGETDMADYVSLTTQRTLEVVVPPLPEQRAIAEVLGALDDKIELNRRMNATLEAMARALFQSWFVDFDPVRAKMAGRAPAGMDTATAALFPAALQESELGPIPAGWRVESLDGIASFRNGLALQKFEATDGGALPVIKIAQLRKGDTVGADRCSSEIPNDYIINDGDVLFSWSGSLEVDIWCGGMGALNQHLFKVTSEEFPKWFYLQWVQHHLDDFRQIAADKATTMGHIQRKHLADARVLVPPNNLLQNMTSAMQQIWDQYTLNRIQNRQLAAIRDALLPKLLSGEMDVAGVG
jgi:type I restriction enzyme S subunit